MKNEKEKNKMNDFAFNKRVILDEQATRKIISASPVKVTKRNEFNDLYLTDEERIAHASNILKSRKDK